MPDREITYIQHRDIYAWATRPERGENFVQFLDERFNGTGLFLVKGEPLALLVEKISDGTKGDSRLRHRVLCSNNHARELGRAGVINFSEGPHKV